MNDQDQIQFYDLANRCQKLAETLFLRRMYIQCGNEKDQKINSL